MTFALEHDTVGDSVPGTITVSIDFAAGDRAGRSYNSVPILRLWRNVCAAIMDSADVVARH
ncbi:hypothetical protein [Nonomuraea sp. NPDC049480]|uniref:hypothetical protein n=1 Tax=Nonomuraea sp. NPDC049480 TaxID=3364353 RepID=UPI003792B762